MTNDQKVLGAFLSNQFDFSTIEKFLLRYLF